MKTAIGKNTLGGGKKMNVALHNYNRSTHDLSQVTRTTMAPGVLVPTLKLLMLPGDTFDIDVRCHTLTHPTVGPLFGSFKQQNDFFFCPIRLYNAMLHNNTLNIGLDMSKVKLPQIIVPSQNMNNDKMPGSGGTLNLDVNPSSLPAYLGLRSTKRKIEGAGNTSFEWNAVPFIAYYDIFKNYYANKQEEYFYTINGAGEITYDNNFDSKNSYSICLLTYDNGQKAWTIKRVLPLPFSGENINVVYNQEYQCAGIWISKSVLDEYLESDININIFLSIFVDDFGKPLQEEIPFTPYYMNLRIQNNLDTLLKNGILEEIEITEKVPFEEARKNGKMYAIKETVLSGVSLYASTTRDTSYVYLDSQQYEKYRLENIDMLRESILGAGRGVVYLNWDDPQYQENFITDCFRPVPYANSQNKLACANPMTGLALKTYQSDINVNWVNTEWIDGDNGINAITAIDTSSGSFTIDQLNLATKVYTMLNRIAVSDGSYNAWIQTVYTSGGLNHIETPLYIGGSSLEIDFQEVINNSGSADEPLGTIAGRGVATNHKGGHIKFKADEPGYIMCISSITPRVDYFQGNDFDMYFTDMDNLHKPQLDGIGFQDRLYRHLNAQDVILNQEKSIGKQPAWIEYMTNVNKTYGNFALIENEGWMCLNRIFEGIDTYTTYVQPHLYNNIFADTEITSQNFWVQIGFNIKARRVMSAKQIPNL